MARTEIHVGVPPEDVFGVLTDAQSYADWVAGSNEVRDVDARGPRPGGRFHHTIGWAGPLTVEDHTEVEEIDPPRSLVLRVKTRPWAVGRVELYLKPDEDGAGTTVIMYESAVGGLVTRAASLLLDLPLRGRNVESLRRLKEIAELRARG